MATTRESNRLQRMAATAVRVAAKGVTDEGELARLRAVALAALTRVNQTHPENSTVDPWTREMSWARTAVRNEVEAGKG